MRRYHNTMIADPGKQTGGSQPPKNPTPKKWGRDRKRKRDKDANTEQNGKRPRKGKPHQGGQGGEKSTKNESIHLTGKARDWYRKKGICFQCGEQFDDNHKGCTRPRKLAPTLPNDLKKECSGGKAGK